MIASAQTLDSEGTTPLEIPNIALPLVIKSLMYGILGYPSLGSSFSWTPKNVSALPPSNKINMTLFASAGWEYKEVIGFKFAGVI